jgi:hypothetical protein
MERPKTSLKRARSPSMTVIVAVLAVLGGTVVALRAWRNPAAPAPAARTEPQSFPSGEAPEGEEPPLAGLTPLLEKVSSNGLFRAAFEGDFVRRWAVVIDNLSEGSSPRSQLGFLAPSLPFTVIERGGTTVIDPASYERHDAFANTVASVDAQALARAYGALRGPLQAAYRLLGYPGASIDGVVGRALDRIESTPVEKGEVLVKNEGGVFVFQERRLERLGDVEKHLVRMGPRNTRLLQAKAREIRRALVLPTVSSRSAAGVEAR